ncbi:MAG: WGR domain-containing protein, partial [Actinobacteria bacterium]|nr:WGR domain-containing protein [Actinomycetota bacterium]
MLTRVAHNPITNTLMNEKLINPWSYADGTAKMMHLIDPANNNSKYYEMVIIPAGQGRFKLLKVWGRLTDTGRIGKLVEDHPTLESALKSMAAKTREELRKGYKDTFQTNRGQY